ncbi:MAG: 50S ribosomal protein L6 [Chloroflexota bacterium]|nr:50S ribosomal protein L6 [Chloroflexota bacterium]
MSRIGRMPIPKPEDVKVEINGNRVTVRGPRGELTRELHPDMMIELRDDQIVVRRPSDQKQHKALHGLTRTLLANMVEGVTKGYTKGLRVEGLGYRAEKQGENLVLRVGFSHPVEVEPPPGITFTVEDNSRTFVVEGIDKELVGNTAASIRDIRPPEPYKGKGIRYEGEHIRLKPGKVGKVGVGADVG